MFKRSFFLNNRNAFNKKHLPQLFKIDSYEKNPIEFQKRLLNYQYLFSCQQFIDPKTNNNLLHRLLFYPYWGTPGHKKAYIDIAIQLATAKNIFQKNNFGYTPIHYAFENGDILFLDGIIDKKIIIQKQPYDSMTISVLVQDPNPNDGIYDKLAEQIYDEDTFENAMKKYRGK
jgi:hypothetical protein